MEVLGMIKAKTSHKDMAHSRLTLDLLQSTEHSNPRQAISADSMDAIPKNNNTSKIAALLRTRVPPAVWINKLNITETRSVTMSTIRMLNHLARKIWARETLFDKQRESVFDSRSPEMASNDSSKATRLIMNARINDQLTSSFRFNSGLETKGLTSNRCTLNAL
jgi:hypothetical protein